MMMQGMHAQPAMKFPKVFIKNCHRYVYSLNSIPISQITAPRSLISCDQISILGPNSLIPELELATILCFWIGALELNFLSPVTRIAGGHLQTINFNSYKYESPLC